MPSGGLPFQASHVCAWSDNKSITIIKVLTPSGGADADQGKNKNTIKEEKRKKSVFHSVRRLLPLRVRAFPGFASRAQKTPFKALL